MKSHSVSVTLTIFQLAIRLACVHNAAASSGVPGDLISPVTGNDVMGQEEVTNEERCRRLCWYRTLCTSYSYCFLCPRGKVNCRLHSYYVEGGNQNKAAHPDWTEKRASRPTMTSTTLTTKNRCVDRPCGSREICVPDHQGGHHCLDKPALCDLTIDIPGAVLNSSRHEQGHVNQVLCQQYHLLVPSNADVEVECQVNSRWTSFKGKCIQVEFVNASDSLTVHLPWPIGDGWGLCVRGVFEHPLFHRISLTPEPCQPPHCAMNFRLVTRMGPPTSQSLGIYWRNVLAGRKVFLHRGALPFQAGDPFIYGIQVTDTELHVDLRSRVNYTYSIPTLGSGHNGSDISLEEAVYLDIHGSITLSYVNILEYC